MQKKQLPPLLALGASFALKCLAAAQLPGSELLNAEGDLSAQMVAGISNFLDDETDRVAKDRARFWKRDFSTPAAYEASISTNRHRLREMIGATEKRIEFKEIEFTSNSGRDSKIAENERYAVYTVKWP